LPDVSGTTDPFPVADRAGAAAFSDRLYCSNNPVIVDGADIADNAGSVADKRAGAG
jgi:hypothetical protein